MNIQRGDILIHRNGSRAVAVSGIERNTCGEEIVAIVFPIVFEGKEYRFQMPWNVTWIVQVERAGAVVPIQPKLF